MNRFSGDHRSIFLAAVVLAVAVAAPRWRRRSSPSLRCRAGSRFHIAPGPGGCGSPKGGIGLDGSRRTGGSPSSRSNARRGRIVAGPDRNSLVYLRRIPFTNDSGRRCHGVSFVRQSLWDHGRAGSEHLVYRAAVGRRVRDSGTSDHGCGRSRRSSSIPGRKTSWRDPTGTSGFRIGRSSAGTRSSVLLRPAAKHGSPSGWLELLRRRGTLRGDRRLRRQHLVRPSAWRELDGSPLGRDHDFRSAWRVRCRRGAGRQSPGLRSTTATRSAA